MSNPIINDANAIAEGVNKAAANPNTPVVADAVKSRVPKRVRDAIYQVGIALGVVATAGSIVAASLDGQPALLVGAVTGAVGAVSSLIAKLHLSD